MINRKDLFDVIDHYKKIPFNKQTRCRCWHYPLPVGKYSGAIVKYVAWMSDCLFWGAEILLAFNVAKTLARDGRYSACCLLSISLLAFLIIEYDAFQRVELPC